MHQPEWLTGSRHRQKPERPADSIDVNRQVVAATEQQFGQNLSGLDQLAAATGMEGNDTSESENDDEDESSSGAEDGTGDSSSEGEEEEEEDITQITPQEKQAAPKGKKGPKAKPTARKFNAGGAKGRR